MVRINGEWQDLAGKSLAAFLAESAYDLGCIAVERNGEIIPKSRYAETVLEEGDAVEIVGFVGGG